MQTIDILIVFTESYLTSFVSVSLYFSWYYFNLSCSFVIAVVVISSPMLIWKIILAQRKNLPLVVTIIKLMFPMIMLPSIVITSLCLPITLFFPYCYVTIQTKLAIYFTVVILPVILKLLNLAPTFLIFLAQYIQLFQLWKTLYQNLPVAKIHIPNIWIQSLLFFFSRRK